MPTFRLSMQPPVTFTMKLDLSDLTDYLADMEVEAADAGEGDLIDAFVSYLEDNEDELHSVLCEHIQPGDFAIDIDKEAK